MMDLCEGENAVTLHEPVVHNCQDCPMCEAIEVLHDADRDRERVREKINELGKLIDKRLNEMSATWTNAPVTDEMKLHLPLISQAMVMEWVEMLGNIDSDIEDITLKVD